MGTCVRRRKGVHNKRKVLEKQNAPGGVNPLKDEVYKINVYFTTRRETCLPGHINNVQFPQAEEIKYLGLHLDRRLIWRNHIFAKRKQLGITLTKMNWLLGRQSKLTTSNKLLAYKVGPMVCNFWARPPPLISKS
jgi:hypothetical protein